ncbi:toxin-antitoxin system YwqK family antitoxin, partial [bacterium]|nr:toxin-antitoxin system YwqK family antitoxin [bacterium]
GVEKRWYPDGVLAFERKFRNDKLDGFEKFYYSDSASWSEGEYRDGIKVGLWSEWTRKGLLRQWFPTKKKSSTESNISQKQIVEEKHPNGKLKFHQEFLDERPNGTWITWYSDGQQKEQIEYKQGLRHGLSQKWYENGRIDNKTHYRNGLKDGVEKIYYPNGGLAVEKDYKAGIEEGLESTWLEGGKKWYTAEYRSGKIIWVKWFEEKPN